MSNVRYPRSSAGFTLIEILVVIGIIALLSSIIFVRFNSARARARDAERISEIKSFQNALELFFTNNNRFPIATSDVVLDGTDSPNNSVEDDFLNAGTIPSIPSDPLNSGNFQYRYLQNDSSVGTYEIQYYLETDSVLGKDGEEGATSGNPQSATP